MTKSKQLYLKFVDANVQGTITMYWEHAPQTCKALWGALKKPIRWDASHAMFSGPEIMMGLPEYAQTFDPRKLPPENQTVQPDPGELLWFYQEGASALFPDAWEAFLAPIPAAERGDLMKAYHRRLTGDDAAVRLEAARAWSVWEASTSFLLQRPDFIANAAGDEFALAFARIEAHYFVHRGFLEREQQLLENIGRLRHIPSVIVQGRYDMVCPITTAYELHQAFPEAKFVVVGDAGHSMSEPGIRSALIAACDEFGAH